MNTRIVAYLMGGTFQATRHAEGCGVLTRAERDADLERSRHWGRGRRQHGYDALQVWDEAAWSRHPGAHTPRDHACVAKFLAVKGVLR